MGYESRGMIKPLSYQAIFCGLEQYLFYNKKKDTFKNFSKYFVKRKLVIPLCLMYIIPEMTEELISYTQHTVYPHNITQLRHYKFCNPQEQLSTYRIPISVITFSDPTFIFTLQPEVY
jgi:hypothetical protein